MLEFNRIYEGDCLDIMKNIDDKSIDFILCDLPYGATSCKWDVRLDLQQLWYEYERIITDKGVIALFGTEPFASSLRMSNLSMYKYDWYWNKNIRVVFCISREIIQETVSTLHKNH